MKNWKTRLGETIKFVGSCSAGTAVQRATVKQYLEQWNRTTGENVRKTVSESMSMGIKAGRDETEPRKFRRALLPLNMHFTGAYIKEEYMQKVYSYGEGQLKHKLEVAFDNAMLKEGNAVLLSEKLHELIVTPVAFLSKQVLSITVGGKDRGDGFKFSYNPAQGGMFKLGTMGYGAGSVDCPVQIVPAQDFQTYQEDTESGINGTRIDSRINRVVVTTEFTGCSFCMQGAGGDLMAAHMNPDERKTKISPRTVQSVCSEKGKFSGEGKGKFSVYGRTGEVTTGYLGSDEGGGAMTIIGFYGENPTPGWRLYSQQRMSNGKLLAKKIYG